MPRPAWLAIGAAVGALALAALAPFAVALCGLAMSLLAAAARAGRWAWAPRGIAPLALGILAIGLRAGASGPAPAPGSIPTGDGPWIGVVETVGSPRDGSRPATVRIEGR